MVSSRLGLSLVLGDAEPILRRPEVEKGMTKKSHWINAIVATATLFVLASVMMGLQLSLDGTRLIVRNADAVRWGGGSVPAV